MSKAKPITISEGFNSLTYHPSRTPASQDLDSAFCELANYRDGAVYLAHWAGQSEWEIHPAGDEIVMVMEGSTNLTLLIDSEEITHTLTPGQMIVVPQGVWHQFHTPAGVKLMTITPQPTQHSLDRPE